MKHRCIVARLNVIGDPDVEKEAILTALGSAVV
jgi:hypothetical protein